MMYWKQVFGFLGYDHSLSGTFMTVDGFVLMTKNRDFYLTQVYQLLTPYTRDEFDSRFFDLFGTILNMDTTMYIGDEINVLSHGGSAFIFYWKDDE